MAYVADLSGNNNPARRASSTQRPLMKYLPVPHRPYLSFDGVDDSVATTVATTLTNCTIVRFFSGGPTIQTGQTIAAGSWTQALSNFGALVINRALTATETANLTEFANQLAGNRDEYNLQYGADATNELLDVYHSSGHPKRPIIVMVHGGGWRNGDKGLSNVTLNKFQHWLPKGFTCVSVNYKLDVGTDPIDQAHSVAKAMAYVQAHAKEWGCNPRNIVWMGHSAGAHLSNLAQSDASIRRQHGVQPWLGSLLLDSAAYNVSAIMNNPIHWSGYNEPWSGGQAQWTAGSPTLVISQRLPPTMCVVSDWPGPHGEDDSQNTDEWIAAARALGTRVLRRDSPLAHGELNNLLGTTPAVGDDATDATYTPDVDAWLATLGL